MKNFFILIVALLATISCNVHYEVTKDKKVRKAFTSGKNLGLAPSKPIINNDFNGHSFQFLDKVSSNIGEFNPANQSLNLMVWNRENGSFANISLGKYFTQDSFELEGYVTNRNKNDRDYFSKIFSVKDFVKFSIKEQPENNLFKIVSTNDSTGKENGKNIQLRNLSSFSIADDNILLYHGEYSDNDSKNLEFIAQTDPVPLLIIIAAVAIASSATTYLIVRERSESNKYNIVGNAGGYQACFRNNDYPKLELVSYNLFSKNDYRFIDCIKR
jgi:hypothetical protein